MRLYQSGALLTGARDELIRRGGVLVDGPRIAAAGMYACPTMNVHALALRERSGGALER
jgi:hypothetical protein